MPIVRYALTLYFAMSLGVAGLAKLAQPGLLAATLRRQQLLPLWAAAIIGLILPWCEIVLGGVLVVGLAPILAAAVTLFLFISFLAAHIVLLTRKRGADCGCYGAMVMQQAAGASVATAIGLAFLAMIHLWLTIHVPGIDWPWRLTASVLLSVGAMWLGVRSWQRQRWNAVCRMRSRS